MLKAIDLLRDGSYMHAEVARHYLLPMMLGTRGMTPGATVTTPGHRFWTITNPIRRRRMVKATVARTLSIRTVRKQSEMLPFYGYSNAAQHAQFRYDYAKRILGGHWGADPRDTMAGWVVDTVAAQTIPMTATTG